MANQLIFLILVSTIINLKMAPASYDCIFNTICVMDASTLLGTKLVKRLLKRGYTVHAAVQNHGKILHLKLSMSYLRKCYSSIPFIDI